MVAALFGIRNLSELALDGNPVTAEPNYRIVVIEHMATLRHLDLKRVTDDERRQGLALLRQQEERQQEVIRKEHFLEERSATMAAIQREWEEEVAPDSARAEKSKHSMLGDKSKNPLTQRRSLIELRDNALHVFGQQLEFVEKHGSIEALHISYCAFDRFKNDLA